MTSGYKRWVRVSLGGEFTLASGGVGAAPRGGGVQVSPEGEYRQLQAALAEAPEAGAIIPASGGVRKLRWSRSGMGKRGGLRVIYYLRSRQGVIWMLTLYPKNVSENIPAHVLKQIRREIEDV